MPFISSVRGVYGAQGRSRVVNLLGSSISNPASSGIALWDEGFRSSGLYYITTSQGVKQVYVDLTTTDAVTSKAGWMLVGSWSTAWDWSQPATTSTAVFDGTTVRNCFSANFGTMNINFFRSHVSSSITSTGASATSCDFYYYSSSAAAWREWWVTNSSNDIRWSTTVNNGSIPREALRQFTNAYNLKYPYQVNQVWSNLSDGAASPKAGIQGDWWSGLNGTATSIGWHGAGDGSLSILPQGSASTGSGQDCNENQTKFGSDDTSVLGSPNVAWFGTSATANLNANIGTQGSNTNLWLWIK
jgi:hypothetical protein